MPKCLHFRSGSCIRIFFLTLITLEPEVLHRWDASENDHKSKGFPPVKNRIKRLGHLTFIRLFKIRFHSSNQNPQYKDITFTFIFAYQYIFIAWGYLILTFNSWNGRPLSFPPWRRNPQGWLVDCLQEDVLGNYFPSISPRQAEVDKSGDAISNSERLLSSVDNIMHRDFHWSSEAF